MRFWKKKDNADTNHKAFFEQQTLTLKLHSPNHKIKWVHDEPFGRWCIHVEDNDNIYHGYVWQEDDKLKIREWCGICGSQHHHEPHVTGGHHEPHGAGWFQHHHEPHVIGPLECVVAAVEAYLMQQLGIRQAHDASHQRMQSVSRK